MINCENSIVVGVDIQDKLVSMLKETKVKDNVVKLLKAVSILDIETILTQQYPKGLGETIEEIKHIKNFKTIDKVSFSAVLEEEFRELFLEYSKKYKNIIIFGIETHICVYQTALDLKNLGFEVFVVSDCSASRDNFNHKTALSLLKQQGIKITALEIVLFELLKSSKNPCFKEVQGLIK